MYYITNYIIFNFYKLLYIPYTYNNVNNRYAFTIPRTTMHADIDGLYEKRWEQMTNPNANFVQYFFLHKNEKWHP